MTRGLSLHLDMLRLLAALEVLAFHISGFPAFGFERTMFNSHGHEAVTIFFVLSGFVIRHAAGARDANLQGFVVSRLTRVYSVVLPCLVLTFAMDVVGPHWARDLYTGLITDGSPFVRLAIGALMLNEAWVSVQMLSNTPYWSISYEVAYYALFAGLFYLRGWQRWCAAVLIALIAGPRILLLFPIWAIGWWAYRESASHSFPKWLSWRLFAQPILIFGLYASFELIKVNHAFIVPFIGFDAWRYGFAWSRYVLTDTVLGMSIAAHLIGAKGLSEPLALAYGWLEKPIRYFAGQSFTLYLLHQPAMLFVGAVLSGVTLGAYYGWAVALGTMAIVSLVAHVTESQRGRLKPIIAAIVTAVPRMKRKVFA